MERETGTETVKRGLAQMLKGGVIMDVTNAEQARIAEEAGACAVMALERVPHIDKHAFKVPFVCGCRNLGEALRRIGEGAAMIRTKGEALVCEVAKLGRLPVVNFAAGGIATPADAALMMQLGVLRHLQEHRPGTAGQGHRRGRDSLQRSGDHCRGEQGAGRSHARPGDRRYPCRGASGGTRVVENAHRHPGPARGLHRT